MSQLCNNRHNTHRTRTAATDNPNAGDVLRSAKRKPRPRGGKKTLQVPKAMGRELSTSSVSTVCPDNSVVLKALAAGGEVVHDVVADEEGHLALLPVDVDCISGDRQPVRARDLPQDSSVTIRVFRFFEDFADNSSKWEKELRNVNSGSLMWLLVHLRPKMHSMSGAKYGSWFTTHYIRVQVEHFRSAYHMCEEGGCVLAHTFGATSNVQRLVTGDQLSTGYFWFSTPDRAGAGPSREEVCDDEHLRLHGWQHLGREEPFDGSALLNVWEEQGARVDEGALRHCLRSAA